MGGSRFKYLIFFEGWLVFCAKFFRSKCHDQNNTWVSYTPSMQIIRGRELLGHTYEGKVSLGPWHSNRLIQKANCICYIL